MATHWRFLDFGFQPVVVRVSPGGASVDCDASNNQASHAIFVGGITVTGHLNVGGLPPLISVPPVAPFGVVGTASYVLPGSLPASPVRGARVTVRPQWEASQTTHTDAAGHFPVNLTAPAEPGTYRLSFTVSDGACTDSAVVSVNVAPVGARMPPHGPSLSIQLVASLGPGCPPSSAAIAWSVENRGDRDSEPTLARLLADGVTTVFEAPVAALAPGATLMLGSLDVPLGASGLHAFTAQVDPASSLPELREDDNVATACVQVQPACLDLALEEMRFTGSRICAGESLGMAVRVVNRGCVAALPSRVALREGTGEIGSVPLPALAPGEVTTVALLPVFETAAPQDLTLLLDPEGAAGADCDAGSNGLGTSVSVGTCDALPPPPLPDFSVTACDFGVSNPHPAPGDSLRFTATIRNLGPGAAAAFALVRFELGGVPLGAPVPLGALAPEGSAVVGSPVNWAADFTPTRLTVTVDPNGHAEGTAYGNTASRSLPYDLRPLAIGTCPPASPSMFSTCTPCASSPFEARAVVINDGLFDCDSVRVEFWNLSAGNAVLGAVVAPVVPAGGQCTAAPQPVAASVSLTSFGTQTIAAVVDPANARPELDEANNTRSGSLTVSCGPRPDLVAAVRLPAGPLPVPGDTVRAVLVEVFNRGATAAHAVQARLSLSGVTLCNLQMGDLEPSDSSLVVCTTPWVVAAGCAQRLTACADPLHLITESNEANNCANSGNLCGPLPDLIAAVRFPAGPAPVPGDTVRAIEVEVTNRGEATAGAVEARLTLDGVTLCELQMGDLAPSAANLVVCTTPWVVTPGGSQRLEACADPSGQLAESNETNNCASAGVPGQRTDLALFPDGIRATPPNPAPGQQVLIQVGIYSLEAIESTCIVRLEWGLFDDNWWLIGEVPLHLPGGYNYFADAASFTWTMPPVDVVALRFQLVEILPYDPVPENDTAFGTLPWYVPPYTPVTVSDFGAESTPEGVVVRWRSGSPEASFDLERRRDGALGWERLPAPVPLAQEANAARYAILDRAAEPGARLEYRLLLRGAEGVEVLATASVVHSAALPRTLTLHPARPNPFRPGGVIEYSVPEPRAVELCVYDAAGRRVAVLRSGLQPAGRHAATWSGRDERGQRAPAGVYFCRLTAGAFVQTQRFVLVH